MSEPTMQLPPGKTCGDCVHFRRCEKLFGCDPTSVTCDWSPSRFSPADQVAQVERVQPRRLIEELAKNFKLGSKK